MAFSNIPVRQHSHGGAYISIRYNANTGPKGEFTPQNELDPAGRGQGERGRPYFFRALPLSSAALFEFIAAAARAGIVAADFFTGFILDYFFLFFLHQKWACRQRLQKFLFSWNNSLGMALKPIAGCCYKLHRLLSHQLHEIKGTPAGCQM